MGADKLNFEEALTADYAPAKAWVTEQADKIPAPVAHLISMSLSLSLIIFTFKAKQAGIFRQLQRALGITPSSERSGKGSSGKDNLDPVQRLLNTIAEAIRLRNWHRRMANKQNKKQKGAQRKMDQLRPDTDDDAYDDDDEISPEEEAALVQEELACQARLALGHGADPSLAPLAETLMTGETAVVLSKTVECPVEQEDLPKSGIVQKTFSQTRQRLDLSFNITLLDIEVEKKSVITSDGKLRFYTGDVEAFGPAKMRVTWNFLVHLGLQVSLYAMPLHRFARMVSSQHQTFKTAQMWRYYRFMAQRFAPIYNHLGLSLAQADVLMGDDTGSRVLEVNRHYASTDAPTPPWQDYATVQASENTGEDNRLGCQLGRVWGFVSPRKDGKGDKRSLNTTVVSGRTLADQPRSTVIFYRSHLGGLGNLLDIILQHKPDNSSVVVQADLATVNLVSEANQTRLHVTTAGCSSHARRPFKLHQEDSPERCYNVLHQFKGIPIYEASLNLAGRNHLNTLAVRDVDERRCWESIRENCEILEQEWSPKTNLGDAARYVLRHYEKLTYYLKDPRIAPTNNLSERLLRMEKIIANNALFRQTLEGRFALDIVRSVLQTAIAAEVDLSAYLTWVLRMPAQVVAENPADYTPLAFAAWEAAQQSESCPPEAAQA